MRLSRSRVLLRVVLLGLGGLVLLARGVQLLRSPDDAVSSRVGLAQVAVAALALVTAAGAAASLRRRRREPTFRLGDERPSGPSPQTQHQEVSMQQLELPPGIVDGATAQRLAADGAVVVDVRTPAEYAAGHVPGARNVPYDQVARRAAEIGPPTTPVVVYCKSGQRSAIARQELRKLGFERVWDARSYEAWPKPSP